jgi:NADH dehydrogenase [ubiquinone] 1 alpha subcomplex assembly factor 5
LEKPRGALRFAPSAAARHSAAMSDAITVFDRRTLRRRRERAAATGGAEFLFVEAAERLAERLEDISRVFPRALDLGCRGGLTAQALATETGGRRGGIVDLVQADPAPGFAARTQGLRIAADPEILPFAPASFDAVLSALALHWVNDLPGALLQLRRALRPDGLLLASLLGGETLTELRQVLIDAEIAEEGGLSPRVSPFADSRDLGGLLQRAGFALPVVDSDRITVTYPDALALMRELRAMGESNAVVERRRSLTRRATLLRAAALYAERFALPDGRIPATFEIITLTGWAPHESQPKPLRPGSATTRLATALGGAEKSAGDKAGGA